MRERCGEVCPLWLVEGIAIVPVAVSEDGFFGSKKECEMAQGKLLAEGKTKKIFEIPDSPNVIVISKDDITAGDGAKHDVFPNKRIFANRTNAAVFELLNACDIPTAFVGSVIHDSYVAEWCEMLPYEVVIRRLALGSYCKRNPHVQPGTLFDTLVVEFFLKTTDKKFKGMDVPKDDPIITAYGLDGALVYRADQPVGGLEGVARVPPDLLYGKDCNVGHPMKDKETSARKVFLVLESAWAGQRCTLSDLKIEFGYTKAGKLVVADVIDNDSWRLFDPHGGHLDKQRYRDGGDLKVVATLYENVAERVSAFASLREKSRVILWRASEKDDPRPFMEALRSYGSPVDLVLGLGSVHKKPEACLKKLRAMLRDQRETVLIVFVGRSNGAGPVFAAETHVPVITVPATVKEFPDDVWSSLRMPSDLPLMTVLDPANAMLAAIGILSQRSPHAYMARRVVIENARLDRSNSPTFGCDF